MNWKVVAVEKLKDYDAKKVSAQNLGEEIQELKTRRRGIRSTHAGSISVQGCGVGREDAMLNSMTLQCELEVNLLVTRKWLARVERGMSVLEADERMLLEKFYIHPERGAADRLATDMGIDVKTVYRRKDLALRKFTIAMCGCSES